MSSILDLSVQQLLQAADLKEKIAGLENELNQLLGSSAKTGSASGATKAPKKRGGMSAAGKAKIAAAQKARWAKVKAAKSAVKPAATPAKAAVVAKLAKKKFVMSAAAKARWAKLRATKK
jgi:hypothetical protein